MAAPTPTRDAVETFISITGASERVALRRLEEFGGNLHEAVHAHFSEGDRNIPRPSVVAMPSNSPMHINDPRQARSRGFRPLLSAAKRFRPSLLLDPNYRRDLYDRISAATFTGNEQHVSHPGTAREELSQNSLYHSGGVYRINDEQMNYNINEQNTSHLYGGDIEEEMVKAAIEASKDNRELYHAARGSYGSELSQIQLQEDEDLARAISLSLQMVEQEKAKTGQLLKDGDLQARLHHLSASSDRNNNSRLEVAPSLVLIILPYTYREQDVFHLKPYFYSAEIILQVGSSSQKKGIGSMAESLVSYQNATVQQSRDILPEQWGGISFDELHEAMSLETALFGELSEKTSHGSLSTTHLHGVPDNTMGCKLQPSSSSLSSPVTAASLLREQQTVSYDVKKDREYHSSLLADQRKEMNASKEVQTHCSKEQESCKSKQEREEDARAVHEKEYLLPKEPPLDDENSITVMVRMPDGSRPGHRFLKTDKLQVLSYPRRAYGVGDSSLTFSEIGLTSKQEVVFLELT